MKLIELAFFTDRVKQMADFYSRLLGSEPVAQSEDMAIFSVGETKVFIHYRYTPGENDLPPNNHIAFAVDDVDGTCARLVEQGLILEVPPCDYDWGRSAYLRDPDGQQVEITRSSNR
jgi:catechol 2,3-dioxygenase-like lactoylglutathione lyase family enzyme